MAELDQIKIRNPLSEEYEVHFNGESYKIGAGEVQVLPQFLARHLAKNLSDRLCALEVEKRREAYKKKKEVMTDVEKAMLTMQDNPLRRITLYQCLESKEQVWQVLTAYPQFKAQDGQENFVGEKSEFEDFVKTYEEEKNPVKEETPKEENKEDKPTSKKKTSSK